ncbi:excalibur calcium-binding domain-containing protein [Streptomyces sp. CA-132043]|uniref:excalibur calcium-binding domain-containing protein n=1 Tax=Streptomyces sp. CA-132043 TaxID=3240048 RepID=UPI003D911A62
MRTTGPAALLAGAAAVVLTAGGCASESGGASKDDRTVTATVTAPPSSSAGEPTGQATAPSSSPPPSQVPREAAPETARDAAATVEAYFAAINAGDYRQAWELGGKNLGGAYEAFVDGFATTERDTVRVVGVHGDAVTVRLEALQTDGSTRSFAGTYTVNGGMITGAAIRSVGEAEPSEPGNTGGSPYYKYCSDARDADAAPIESGEPGYAEHLDRDKDATACESGDGVP